MCQEFSTIPMSNCLSLVRQPSWDWEVRRCEQIWWWIFLLDPFCMFILLCLDLTQKNLNAKEGCLTSRWSSFGSDSSIISALISWRCHGEIWKHGVFYHQTGHNGCRWFARLANPGRLMKRRLVMMLYWKSWMYWSYLDVHFFEKLFRKGSVFVGRFLVVWM